MNNQYINIPHFAGDLLRAELAHLSDLDEGWSATDTGKVVGDFVDELYACVYSKVEVTVEPPTDKFEEGFTAVLGTNYAMTENAIQGLFAHGRITVR